MKPRRPKAEYAVPEAVLDLLNRFDYPETDRPTPTVQPSGGGGQFTVTIAAANAADIEKSKTDYQCTGVNDEAIIQEAIDTVKDLNGGVGLVQLSRGTFNLSWDVAGGLPIDIDESGCRLEGVSSTDTILNVTGSPGVGDGVITVRVSGSRVAHLRIEDDGTGSAERFGIIMSGSYNEIEDVTGYVTSVASSAFIYIDGVEHSIRHVSVDGGVIGIYCAEFEFSSITDCLLFASDTGIHVDTLSNNVVVAGNYVNGFSRGILVNEAQDIIIANNNIDAVDGIYVTDSTHVVVSDNTVDGSGVAITVESTGAAVGPVAVSGNVCQAGITLDTIREFAVSGNESADAAANGLLVVDCVDGVVIGNQVHDAANHGILVDSNDVLVAGNHVDTSGRQTTNTYDNIHVTGDRNVIVSNLLVPAGAGNTTRYGINIASGSNNAVYANYLGDSSVYGTADSIDSGTATQTTPAAGAIGGQFAY